MIGFIQKIFQKYSKDGMYLFISYGLTFIINLILLPIVLQGLSVSDYGLFQLIVAIQAWLFAFSGIHITAGTIRGIANNLNGTVIFSFLKRLKLLALVAICGIIIASFLYFTDKYQVFSILLAIVSVYLIIGYLPQISYTFFLIAKKKMKQYAIFNIFITSLAAGISTAVAFYTKNVIWYSVSFWGAMIIISMVFWSMMVIKYKLIQQYRQGLIDKQCYKYGFKLIPVDIITITAQKISYFFISYFIGLSQLAVFSVAFKFKEKVAELIRLTPNLLYSDFAKQDKEHLIKTINKYLIKILSLGLIIAAGTFWAWYAYIKLFLPVDYASSIPYLAILMAGLPAAMASIILHTLLVSHLRNKELTAIGVLTSVINILLIIILGVLFKVMGVCIALAINYWLSFLFYYYFTIKKDKVAAFLKDKSIFQKIEPIYNKYNDRFFHE